MSALSSIAFLLAPPYLDHLNKGDTEVEIGQVSTDQTQAEEYTNRNDGAQVDAPSHLNRLPAIE